MTSSNEFPTPTRLLLVEGKDDKRFLEALARHLGETGITVEIYGGKPNLGNRLVNLAGRLNDFIDPSIGIVRDADNSSQSAFDSVAGSLRRAGMPTPDGPMALIERDGLRISVLILPPDDEQGELENVCLRSVAGSRELECVEDYLNCLESLEPAIAANQMAKAKLHSYLAIGPVRTTDDGNITRRRPALRLGEAAEAGVWDWTSPAFQRVTEFLLNL